MDGNTVIVFKLCLAALPNQIVNFAQTASLISNRKKQVARKQTCGQSWVPKSLHVFSNHAEYSGARAMPCNCAISNQAQLEIPL